MRFHLHSQSSPQVLDSENVPCTGPYDGWEEHLSYAIHSFEERDRLLHVCNRPMTWEVWQSPEICYHSRFCWLGNRDDIEKAIELCRAAIAGSSPNDESYPDILSYLPDYLL